MPQDLDALRLTVRDEESFRNFIAALAGDYSEEREIEAATPSSPYSAGALGWEHGSIDGYLGAARHADRTVPRHTPAKLKRHGSGQLPLCMRASITNELRAASAQPVAPADGFAAR